LTQKAEFAATICRSDSHGTPPYDLVQHRPNEFAVPTSAGLQVSSASSPKVARRQGRTRERILLESGRLFLARGFESVSVDHIVTAAEIARSSFYRFFPNREEVLASIIRPVFESGLAMMDEVRRRPPREITDGILGMYLSLWRSGPQAMQLATRMGGRYFRIFEDVHAAYRGALVELLTRVEPTGQLLNGSGAASARLLARCAVPVLEVYRDDPALDNLFRRTLRGMLLKPEATP
jgi:AcrR family transcriptional regulator